MNELRQQAEKEAHTLTTIREKSAKKVEEEMKQRLVPLGIPNVRFSIDLTQKSLSHDGADKVSFLFSANKSTPLQPITQVASGGEIARVMLSLKAMISGAVKLPTIIFDEIDTGVSGKIAEKMANIMVEMGNHERQVLSITHLPQIAALQPSLQGAQGRDGRRNHQPYDGTDTRRASTGNRTDAEWKRCHRCSTCQCQGIAQEQIGQK